MQYAQTAGDKGCYCGYRYGILFLRLKKEVEEIFTHMSEEMKARVLFFVEDEPDIVELYTIAFEGSGFQVQSINNGKEALEALSQFTEEDVSKPNVMILDILLPDASGMDILREARKNPLFDNTPIIMFTNFSSDEIRSEIDKLKNTRYLLKMEVTPDQLVETIKDMLGL